MYNPFFSIKSLSDQDLLKKYQDLQQRLMQCRQFGYSPQLVSQIQNMLEICEHEFNERDYMSTFNKSNYDEDGDEIPSSVIIGED